MKAGKKTEKLTNTEQIVFAGTAVASFMILKNIIELSFGLSGIVVWAVTGAVGGLIGWTALKIFKSVRKK